LCFWGKIWFDGDFFDRCFGLWFHLECNLNSIRNLEGAV
jgi:hypothetical protein